MRRTRIAVKLINAGSLQWIANYPLQGGVWQVRREFEDVLRSMQRISGRQRTPAAHGALLSHERTRIQITDLKDVNELEGRVLGHGQKDATSRPSWRAHAQRALRFPVHRLVSLNRSPRRAKFTKVLFGLQSPFDRTMILLQNVLKYCTIAAAQVRSFSMSEMAEP